MGDRSPEPDPLADLWLPEQTERDSLSSGWEVELHEFPDLVEPSLSGGMADSFIGEEASPKELPNVDLHQE